METTFTAPGISCQGCANTIEKALGNIPDVSGVTVDVPKKSVTVRHGERVERETLAGALAAAGYPAAADDHPKPARGATTTVKDPVCGMEVDPDAAAGKSDYAGTTYSFCSTSCKQKFDSDPRRYLSAAGGQPAPAHPEGVFYTCPMHPEIVRDKPGSCPICGMALEPMTATGDDTNPELVDMSRRFRVCLALTAPLLLLAMGEMVVGQQAISRLFPGRSLAWLQLALATPVVLWGGRPFFERGWASLVHRHLNMFTLIALGTGAAYVYSVAATLFPGIFPTSFRDHLGNVPVYFEAAAVITTLVLLGQVLELRARSQTSSASRPCSASPRRRPGGSPMTAARRTSRSKRSGWETASASGPARRCRSTAS